MAMFTSSALFCLLLLLLILWLEQKLSVFLGLGFSKGNGAKCKKTYLETSYEAELSSLSWDDV